MVERCNGIAKVTGSTPVTSIFVSLGRILIANLTFFPIKRTTYMSFTTRGPDYFYNANIPATITNMRVWIPSAIIGARLREQPFRRAEKI